MLPLWDREIEREECPLEVNRICIFSRCLHGTDREREIEREECTLEVNRICICSCFLYGTDRIIESFESFYFEGNGFRL